MLAKKSNISEKITYVCHCECQFDSFDYLFRHAYAQHSQFVKSLKAFFTTDSEIYQIDQTTPLQDSEVNSSHVPQNNQNKSSQIIPQEQQKKNMMIHNKTKIFGQNVEPEMNLTIQIPESGTQQIYLSNLLPAVESGVDDQNKNIHQPTIFLKKRGRKPKCSQIGCAVPQKTNQWVTWFNSKFARNFSFPQIDFKDCTKEKNASKLTNIVSKYLTCWGIKQKTYFDQDKFVQTRDRLIIFNTLLLCEEAYLKWRQLVEIPSGRYVAFFNYFIISFLPCLLRQQETANWMDAIESHILMRRHIVLKEISNFLLWCRRNQYLCSEVHKNPYFNLAEVFLIQDAMNQLKIQKVQLK